MRFRYYPKWNKLKLKMVYKIIIAGPNKPTNIPPGKNSFCFTIPILKATAFGGVDTGSNKAQEADRPIITGKNATFAPGMMLTSEIPTGTKMVVAAVLLIKFDNSTDTYPKITIIT